MDNVVKKVAPLSLLNSMPPEQPKFSNDQKKTDANLAKGADLLAELERENESGFQLDDDKFGNKKSGLAGLSAGLDKKSSDEAIGDNYDDDFDDEIEEDLPDQHDDLQIEDEAAARNQPAMASGSGHGITVSQSLGVDPSVDSLALEDYDYTEPVERIG